MGDIICIFFFFYDPVYSCVLAKLFLFKPSHFFAISFLDYSQNLCSRTATYKIIRVFDLVRHNNNKKKKILV